MIQGTFILTLQEGCTVNTDSVTIIAPRYEAEVVMDGTITLTQASPYQWIEEGEAPHFQQTARELLQHVGQKAKLSEIRALTRFKSKKDTLHAPRWQFSLPHWFLHGIFPSLSTILFIAVAWYVITRILIPLIKRRQSNRRDEQITRYTKNPEATSLHGPDWELDN